MTLSELNGLDQAAFVRLVGPVFEHSPWIAQAAWPRRPFGDLAAMHQELCRVVADAKEAEKLGLIRAHPDLAARSALTQASAAEQASAGLNQLTAEELDSFRQRNATYRDKFGFPFVICARLNKKDTILAELARRLQNAREDEIQTALAEIFKIAELRLRGLIHE
jgi:2-oxo-4-hydroxy-4-carboxy-5-ureidoimidazoline decarboxylase